MKKTVYFFVILLLLSCSEKKSSKNLDDENKKENVSAQTNVLALGTKDSLSVDNNINVQENKNFFDKKYNVNYLMVVDESTLADHPIQNFLDCKDSYFTIHYVPKTQELKDFWNINYFQNLNLDNINFEKESTYIESKIKGHLNDYSIFCYYVQPQYLGFNGGCTEESVFLKTNAKAQIYHYKTQEKKWELVKETKSMMLPRIMESNYFNSNFPHLFN